MSQKPNQRSLSNYLTLGRSGLRVSPLCLGTGTFGNGWGESWSTDLETSRGIMRAYVDAGGNFLDTADIYHHGSSEEITGQLVKEFGGRERFVIATKFTLAMDATNPNRAGNGRGNIMAAVEDSLHRLGTSYIDLYYMHWWDAMTPAEEVMAALDTLVRSGKVRYIGLSNPPAWYFTKAQMLALQHGRSPVIALQMQYSLLVRDIEDEHVDAAAEFGTGILPWSPLANGLLSGKYQLKNGELQGDGRYTKSWVTDANLDLKAERTGRTLDALRAVASEVGTSPAQVALHWVQTQRGVASTIIGASKPQQVADNIAALSVQLTDEQRTRLDEASKPPARYPYTLTHVTNRKNIIGENPVRGWGK